MNIADRRKGSPPNCTEIYVVIEREYYNIVPNQGYTYAFLCNLYREDLFYSDYSHYRYLQHSHPSPSYSCHGRSSACQ